MNPNPRLSLRALRAALCVLATPAVLLHADLITNGDMSAGDAQPTGWDKRWVGQGKLLSARDQVVFHSAPASLRISGQDGSAKGQISQHLPVSPGETISASGWIKCEGADTTAQIGLQFFKGYAPVSFTQMKYVAGTTDWIRGKATVVVPADADKVGFIILLDGDGQAWLDDATITRVDTPLVVEAPKPLPIPTPTPVRVSASVSEPGSGLVDTAQSVANSLAGEGTLIAAVADFRRQTFSYGYESWKDLSAVMRRIPEGLLLTGGADGGGGVVYGSPAPIEGATHLRLRFIVNSGQTADQLQMKLLGKPQTSLSVSFTGLAVGVVQSKLVALPAARPARVEQVQFQGNFTPNQKFNVTLLDAAFVRLP